MVKKFTSEEFCSVAHRQAYHHEQEQLAVARLLEDQNRRKPIRKQLPTQAKEKDVVRERGECLAEPIPESIAARPSKSPRAWHAHLDLLVAAKAAKPDSNSNINGACAALADPEDSSNSISALGASCIEDSMAALSQAEVPTALSALDSCPSSHPGPPFAEILANYSLELLISAERPSAPAFAPVALESVREALLPTSQLEPQEQVPLNIFELRNDEGAQLSIDLSSRCRAVIPDSIAAPRYYGPGISHVDAALLNWQKPPLADSRPSLQCLLSVPIASPVLPGSGPAFAASKPLVRCFAQSLAYLPKLAVVIDTEDRLSDLPSPAIVCYAGSIQRLFSRPRPSVPRPVRLEWTNEYPQPVRAAVIPSQSNSAALMLARPLGKCKPFDRLFSHPDSFLRSVAGKSTASETFFAFDQPFAPKPRIAIVRRSSISLNADSVRVSRQAKIKVRPDPGVVNQMMCECIDPHELPVLKPQLNLPISPARTSNSAFEALSAFSSGGHAISWAAVQRHWRDAPNDLRWIALAVPLIFGLIWFADSPSAQNGAKGRIASMVPNVGNLFKVSFSGDSLEGLKQNIQRRAAVELSDDFRQGLGEWAGAGDWSKGWSYDSAGFLRPHKLALYTPSLSLEDYRFEFLGAIERRALSWVVRAADIKNYYAYRLEITRSGPLPTVELVRYSVVNGRTGSRKSIPLHLQARLDTIYRIRMDVSGSDLVTTIQGQVVDVFSDGRLTRGGVGFFSEAGEDSRLRWIEVSHQYDMLGRLCAYLVPYNVSNSNVRSAP